MQQQQTGCEQKILTLTSWLELPSGADQNPLPSRRWRVRQQFRLRGPTLFASRWSAQQKSIGERQRRPTRTGLSAQVAVGDLAGMDAAVVGVVGDGWAW